jgi:hypothetical protein
MILTAYSNMSLSSLLSNYENITKFYLTPLLLTDDKTKQKIEKFNTTNHVLVNKLPLLYPHTYV